MRISARYPLLSRTASALVFAGLGASAAQAAGVIKIGEINSYKNQPAFLEPYKRGMELAVDEVNRAGGVNGKKLELITGAHYFEDSIEERQNAADLVGAWIREKL